MPTNNDLSFLPTILVRGILTNGGLEPLANTEIRIVSATTTYASSRSTELRVVTDEDGEYSFPLAAGVYEVFVKYDVVFKSLGFIQITNVPLVDQEEERIE